MNETNNNKCLTARKSTSKKEKSNSFKSLTNRKENKERTHMTYKNNSVKKLGSARGNSKNNKILMSPLKDNNSNSKIKNPHISSIQVKRYTTTNTSLTSSFKKAGPKKFVSKKSFTISLNSSKNSSSATNIKNNTPLNKPNYLKKSFTLNKKTLSIDTGRNEIYQKEFLNLNSSLALQESNLINTDEMLSKYLKQSEIIKELDEPLGIKDEFDDTGMFSLTVSNEKGDDVCNVTECLSIIKKNNQNSSNKNTPLKRIKTNITGSSNLKKKKTASRPSSSVTRENMSFTQKYSLHKNILNVVTPKNPEIRKISRRVLSTIKESNCSLRNREMKSPLRNNISNFTPKSEIGRTLFHTQQEFYPSKKGTIKREEFRGKIEDYIIGKEIGKGSYAIVKKGLNRNSNRKVAIKIYDKISLFDPQKKSSVKKEIEILKICDHENIVKLYEVIDTSKFMYLVMELISGISLLSFLKEKENRIIPENECKNIYVQIVKGINYCHLKNISHRDIKLENVLLVDNEKVKIIDFGFGVKCPKNTMQKFFCGTPSYMPPEIVQKKNYIGQYADVWSLGILLYCMLCGAFPFRATKEDELYSKIIKGDFTFPDFVSEGAKKLIKKMLNKKPSERPTTEEILLDDWFIKE